MFKTTTKLNTLTQKVDYLKDLNLLDDMKLDDTYALNLLNPLLGDFPFVPFTGASLRPFCLLHIINDIVINKRKNIIEFGAGISTIVIGRLIRKNKLNVKLLSIEHNAGWAKLLEELLKSEGLENCIKVVHAPLKECNLAMDYNEWYDLSVLKTEMIGSPFDMVIVDGPPAWEPSKEKSRYPALPFMRDFLSEKSSIYLDDADRAGEQSILQLWGNKYSIKFNIAGQTLGYAYLGESFYTQPSVYMIR
jgi:hypothetical protein